MNNDLRSRMEQDLFVHLYEYFNDRHTVRDIVVQGFNFKGISNMTDQELLDEYRDAVLYGEEDDELAKEVEASLAIDEMLSSEAK